MRWGGWGMIEKPCCLLKKSPDNHWILPRCQKLPNILTLHHGVMSCQIDQRDMTNRSILPEEMVRSLRLPSSKIQYTLKALGMGHYLVGPLVGIFVNEQKIRKLLAADVDRIYRRFASVLERYNGIAAFFSLKRILWDSYKIFAVVRTMVGTQEKWIEEILPLPVSIYDRCFGTEGRRDSRSLREHCMNSGRTIRIVNALIKLNKIQIYKICALDPILSEHLPRWDVVTAENISQLLEEYSVAYIKPDSLYKGKGVTRVTHRPNGYLVEQRRGEENFSILCKTPQEVLKQMSQYNSGKSLFVIQEAIQLLRYKGRPLDFRLLLQKDKSGQWKETGISGRINGEGSVIASPRSGGDVATFEEVMGRFSKEDRKRVYREMLRFSTRLARTVDNQIGPYVELGFDIGVDKMGRVWLIELNGKPLKVSIDRLKNHEVTVKAYERPIEYAIRVAGFGDDEL
jgi:hypothetical protein